MALRPEGSSFRLIYLAGLVAASCGAGPRPTGEADVGDGKASAICDDTERLRLRAFVIPRGRDESRGAGGRVEHGYESLAIDGMCRYWINSGWEPNRPLFRDRGWREGRLSAAEIATIEETLSVDNLELLRDCPPGKDYHEPIEAFSSATGWANCYSQGTKFERAYGVIRRLAPALWERGSALQGSMRLTAISIDVNVGGPPYQWPLERPLADFLDPVAVDASEFGSSLQVSRPEEAAALRVLRERYLADRVTEFGPGFGTWDGIHVQHGGLLGTLYMRDALPYEKSNGLLPF